MRSVPPRRLLAVCAAATLALTGGACTSPSTTAVAPAAPHRTLFVDTGPLLIDRIYKSMDGPHERLPLDTEGLDWITAYRTEVLDASSGKRMGDEFFCHSQLQLANMTRLLVTATGSEDIVFPAGFGLPLRQILGGIPRSEWRGASFLGMVLNNFDHSMNRQTRVRATIDYLSDAQAATQGIKKLYKVELPMTVQPAPGEAPDAVKGGEHCVLVAGLKSHWMVPPGEQVIRKRYRGIVPVEATVHFANAHLHNHGVRMTLRDVTTGTTLFTTEVAYEPNRRQIARIPEYTDATGFPVHPDHEYEIESVYDNTTTAPVDAMAVVYLYYHPLRDENITYPDPPSGVAMGTAGDDGSKSLSM